MTLWTPEGERPIRREPEPHQQTSSAREPAAAGAPGGALAGAGGDFGDIDFESLTPDQRAEAEAMAAELAEVRQQLASAPAAVVVANHAMGLYELAAIHLNQRPPNLGEARVAIDAFAALVGALEGRLGSDEQALNDALAQLRLAFVQLQGSAAGGGGGGGGGGASAAGAAPASGESSASGEGAATE